MKPLTPLTDSAVVKALAHPLRAQVLGLLEEGEASPNELSERIGVPLPNVSYHVSQLQELGLIVLAREARRRGAIEHYYRIAARPEMSDEGWSAAPETLRDGIGRSTVEQIGNDVAEAAGQGAFGREDVRLTRSVAEIDRKGLQALQKEADRFAKKVRDIEDASADRLAKASDKTALRSHVVAMVFETGAQDDAG